LWSAQGDLSIEPIQAALKHGVRLISEIELACRFISVPILAVTGTMEKRPPRSAGRDVEGGRTKGGRGGNVGEPLIPFRRWSGKWDVLVAEFRASAGGIETLRPDRDPSQRDRGSPGSDTPGTATTSQPKGDLENQTADDLAVLNRDDRW